MDETGKDPSDTKMTDIKTSSDILSEPGGKSGPVTHVYGTEDQPNGAPTKRSGADQLKTSQQIASDLSNPESEKGEVG